MNSKILVCSFSFALSVSAWAQFNYGNLAVLRVGNGTETLTTGGNSTFIDQYTPAGTLVNSVVIPNSGPSGLLVEGNRTGTGWLALSPNGQYLTFAGYRRDVGLTTALQTSLGTDVPRGVGQVNMAGQYSMPISSTVAFSGQSWRAATTDGAGNYWGIGSGANGPYYMGPGTPGALQSTISQTMRSAHFYNGNLFVSVSGTVQGIYMFPGSPTTPTPATLFIGTGAGSAPTEFDLSPLGTVAYIADDRAVASGGGIQKWTLTGETWSLAYTIASGSPNGARGLAVDWTGANPVIYATTGESSATAATKIVRFEDLGVTGTASVIATSGTGTFFRGLELIPEPSTLALGGLGLAALLLRNRRNS